MFLCLSEPGRVRIASVRPLKPVGHITVERFAVRPNPLAYHTGDMVGDSGKSLAQLGFSGSHVMHILCGKSDVGHGYELALQLSRPTRRDVEAYGWVITYRSGGDVKKFTFPLAVGLCTNTGARACKRLDPFWQAGHSG